MNSAYPWQPTYGCGLPEKLGETVEPMVIQADVFSQMLQEASVAKSPAPVVSISPILGGGATIAIAYTDNAGVSRDFVFDLA